MIDRRQMIVGGALLATMPFAAKAGLPVPAGNRLHFDIMRKGSKLGTHELTFTPTADGLTVNVAVDLAYSLMGITLYRYRHRATEIWSGDQVVALQSTTNDNGKKFELIGKRGPGGLAIQATKVPRYIAPADALPATHWNQRELEGPWINTQNGKLMRPKVARQGIEAIPASGGKIIKARRYNLSGEAQLDIWYDDALGWSGLSFTNDKTLIQYQRRL